MRSGIAALGLLLLSGVAFAQGDGEDPLGLVRRAAAILADEGADLEAVDGALEVAARSDEAAERRRELAASPSWVLRVRAVRLAARGGPDLVARVVLAAGGAVDDPEWTVREAAWIAARGVAPDALAPGLDAALEDGSWRVRVAALRAMAAAPGRGGEVPAPALLANPRIVRLHRLIGEDRREVSDAALAVVFEIVGTADGYGLAVALLDDERIPPPGRRRLAAAVIDHAPRDRGPGAPVLPDDGPPFARLLAHWSSPRGGDWWRRTLGLLEAEGELFGPELRALLREAVAERAATADLVRLLAAGTPGARLADVWPATRPAWSRPAFRRELLAAAEGGRFDLEETLAELRALAREDDLTEGAAEVLRSYLGDATLTDRARALALRILVEGGRSPGRDVLRALAEQPSDEMRRAAWEALVRDPEVDDEELADRLERWLDEGPARRAFAASARTGRRAALERRLIAVAAGDGAAAREALDLLVLDGETESLRALDAMDGPSAAARRRLEDELLARGDEGILTRRSDALLAAPEFVAEEARALRGSRDPRLATFAHAAVDSGAAIARAIPAFVAWVENAGGAEAGLDLRRRIADHLLRAEPMDEGERRAGFTELAAVCDRSEEEALAEPFVAALVMRSSAARGLAAHLVAGGRRPERSRLRRAVVAAARDGGSPYLHAIAASLGEGESEAALRAALEAALRPDPTRPDRDRLEPLDALETAAPRVALRVALGVLRERELGGFLGATEVGAADEESREIEIWLRELVLGAPEEARDEALRRHLDSGDPLEAAVLGAPRRRLAWAVADARSALSRRGARPARELARSLVRIPPGVSVGGAADRLLVARALWRDDEFIAPPERDEVRLGAALVVAAARLAPFGPPPEELGAVEGGREIRALAAIGRAAEARHLLDLARPSGVGVEPASARCDATLDYARARRHFAVARRGEAGAVVLLGGPRLGGRRSDEARLLARGGGGREEADLPERLARGLDALGRDAAGVRIEAALGHLREGRTERAVANWRELGAAGRARARGERDDSEAFAALDAAAGTRAEVSGRERR